MECNIIQEFKGEIRGVEFDDKKYLLCFTVYIRKN